MKMILPKSVLDLHCLATKPSKSKRQTPVRYGTLYVLLKAAGGMCRCEATCGKKMGIISGVADGDGEMFILASDLKSIKRIVKAKHTHVVFDANEAAKTCAIGGIAYVPGLLAQDVLPEQTMSCKYYLAKDRDGVDSIHWPKTQTVIPTAAPVYSVCLRADLLADLLQVAQAVNPGSPHVLCQFFDANQPCSISVQSDDKQQAFDGLMIPIDKQ